MVLVLKKTRFFALILALVMVSVMFSGCGGGGGDEESSEEISSDFSMVSVPEVVVKKAEKWTAEHSEVSGWMFSTIADYVFYATEDPDNDSAAYLQFAEKLTDGKTLDQVIQAYIADIDGNSLYTGQNWIIKTPQKITFGGKDAYEISYDLSIQIRAARHYRVYFTQLDDEVFIFNSSYTIREEARDETAIDNLVKSVTFVPMA
jgi:ABC-type glycerol-3-phosphate transport system substrate-binding protein